MPFDEQRRHRFERRSVTGLAIRSYTARQNAYRENPNQSVILEMDGGPERVLPRADRAGRAKAPLRSADLLRGSHNLFTGPFPKEGYQWHRLVPLAASSVRGTLHARDSARAARMCTCARGRRTATWPGPAPYSSTTASRSMKIASIEVIPVRLPMKGVLTLPRGPSRTLEEGKRVALVKMTDSDGNVGWGEAGPSRRWSAETLESCVSSLRQYLAPAVIGHDLFDIAGLHARMNQELAVGMDPGQPIAKCAIDLAVHDLIGKRLGIPVQSWLGAKRVDSVPLARLVSAATPGGAQMTGRARRGLRGFKVKVGHHKALDADIVAAVVAAAEGGYVWADANQGYTLEEAIRMARAFEKLGITLFEQPVAMSDIYGMKKLLSATGLTIALDEGAIGLPFVIELIRREAVEGLAIKVSKVGGLHYARQMCDLALNTGLTLIGSGLMDAPIGFAASVHLFAAYGITLPVDLNGPQFIAEDYLAEPSRSANRWRTSRTGRAWASPSMKPRSRAFALPLHDLGLGMRRFLALLCCAVRCSRRPRRLAGYPTKPVKLVVAFPPGGSTDIAARRGGCQAGGKMAQPVVVENRPGAGGNLGSGDGGKVAARWLHAAVGDHGAVDRPTVFDKLPYDALKDLAPVTMVSTIPNVLVVNPNVPAKTIGEFIAHAKANPGKLNFSAPGASSGQRMTFELIKQVTGTDIVMVAYAGGAPALQAVLGGQVEAMIVNVVEAAGHVKAGKLRAGRSHGPGIPPARSADPRRDGGARPGHFVLAGPARAGRHAARCVQVTRRDLTAVLAMPDVREKLAGLGMDIVPGTPEEFGKFLQARRSRPGGASARPPASNPNDHHYADPHVENACPFRVHHRVHLGDAACRRAVLSQSAGQAAGRISAGRLDGSGGTGAREPGSRSRRARRSSSRTASAPAATSRPRRWRGRRPTATHC